MVTYKGEECWTTEEIMEELYIYAGEDLRRFVRQGMPCIVLGNGRRLFPKERVHAWFRGDMDLPKPKRPQTGVKLSWSKVSALLGAKGFTPMSLEVERGISYKRLYRIKKGGGVKIDTAEKIAKALGVEVEELREK